MSPAVIDQTTGNPPVQKTAHSYRRLIRRSPRRAVSVVILLANGLTLVALLVYSAYYRAPLPSMAQAVLRGGALSALALGVTIHDPVPARLATLAPPETDDPDFFSGYERLETLFLGADRVHSTSAELALVDIHNERIVESAFSFRYQPFDEPRLHQLRTKYRLDEVIALARDELDEFVRLCNWTRSQFRRSDYQPQSDHFDALEVLDRKLHNTTGRPYDPDHDQDPCIFFPRLFAQVVLSVGHQVRLSTIDHGTTEVWSNQYGKWIEFDAELNHYYQKDGVPFSTLEVHDENFAPPPPRMKIVRGTQSSDPNTTLVHLKVPELSPDSMVRYHRHVGIVELRNDWLTNRYFLGHPARSDHATLVFQDDRVSGHPSLAWALYPATRRREDLFWTLNQAEIHARPLADGRLSLRFRTVTPNFRGFAVSIDGRPAIEQPSASFEWTLHPGENSIAVCPINQFDRKGIVSSARLEYVPQSR